MLKGKSALSSHQEEFHHKKTIISQQLEFLRITGCSVFVDFILFGKILTTTYMKLIIVVWPWARACAIDAQDSLPNS